MRFFDRQKPAADSSKPQPTEHTVVELDADQLRTLSNVFAAPKWLRDLGLASWFLAGVAILLGGLIFLAAVTATIVEPVTAGIVIATVAAPIVSRLQRAGLARALGAAIVLLSLVAVAVLILLLVVGGITSQSGAIREQLSAGMPKIQGWLTDLGISSSGAQSVTDSAQNAAQPALSTLFHGVGNFISNLASLAFGLSFAALTIFFVLKDGPSMRDWVDGHMGVGKPVARIVTGNVIQSLQRYFAGVTLVAAFNGVVVAIGALILGVPLAGTIAVVTFVTAYVPYIGAIVAGAFAVILALGSSGTQTALIMLVIVLLANGLLQNVFQPIAFGATLKLNPLLVLVVTIGAGCLFGMVGMILAAPLTSAAIHISGELGALSKRADAESGAPPDPPEALGALV
jgi:predicted PurR-regulated permease PerM